MLAPIVAYLWYLGHDGSAVNAKTFNFVTSEYLSKGQHSHIFEELKYHENHQQKRQKLIIFDR